MSGIYERLGVRTIINAKGPATRLSGAILSNEVAQAMAEASQSCVDIAELQARASAVIAEATGAEAGYITSGAAAGLLEVPLLELVLEPNAKLNAFELVEELQQNTPFIHVDYSRVADGILVCNPMCLKPGEPERIARRLRDLLGP